MYMYNTYMYKLINIFIHKVLFVFLYMYFINVYV